jgi:predicted SAM-dependent methyltransferase
MRPCYCCDKENIQLYFSINLKIINNLGLNDFLNIYKCETCNFYFNDSNNNNSDYINYYNNNNKYKDNINININNKDIKCIDYLNENILNDSIKTILDFGSGNGLISDNLSKNYNIEKYDIGLPEVNKKYDLIILSHVLEHIYDLDAFMKNIISKLDEEGKIYIEIPNAEYYDKFINFGPLQEINIEHINFFSKYALIKFMIKHQFIPINVIDDFFIQNNSNYWVIRGFFKKNYNNKSFEKYISDGKIQLEKINIPLVESIYIYGCGELLYKIFNKIIEKTKVINIIDDNIIYKNKHINNINIIDFETFKEKAKTNDNILITSYLFYEKINEKLKSINKNFNIYRI